MSKKKDSKQSKTVTKKVKKSSKKSSKQSKKAKKKNLLDYGKKFEDDTLKLVKINMDATYLVCFTSDNSECNVHWVNDPELHGYVRCWKKNCPLCEVGNAKKKQLLLPVYSLETNRIEVLGFSDSLKPYSVLSQLKYIFEGMELNKKLVLIISKDSEYTFQLKTKKLPKDLRNTVFPKIKAFKKRVDEENIKLCSVFQKRSRSQLKQIESIKRKLALHRE
jgi:hypothetical protein